MLIYDTSKCLKSFYVECGVVYAIDINFTELDFFGEL